MRSIRQIAVVPLFDRGFLGSKIPGNMASLSGMKYPTAEWSFPGPGKNYPRPEWSSSGLRGGLPHPAGKNDPHRGGITPPGRKELFTTGGDYPTRPGGITYPTGGEKKRPCFTRYLYGTV